MRVCVTGILTANFRSVTRMSNLFCVNDVMTKVQNVVKMSYLWEKRPYWQVGSLTGIPPHIATCVNKEGIIKTGHDHDIAHFVNVLQQDLDRRQLGGGNLNMEIL